MTTTMPPLFESFVQISDSSALFNFMVSHPVLLSPTLLNEIQENLHKLPAKRQQESQTKLNLLIKMYQYFTENLNEYPYGEGPLDKIFIPLFQNQLSLKSAIEIARQEKINSLLSPIYIQFICELTKHQARTQTTEWEKYYQMLTITLESLQAYPNHRRSDEWFQMKAIVIAAYIDVTTTGLIDLPDKRLLDIAGKMGEDLIAEARERQDMETILNTYHLLGLLYLDPWFSGKSSSHYLSQFKIWSKRVFDHYGNQLAGIEQEVYLIPYPTETIDKAIHYLNAVYEALDMDAGPALFKALGDAHMWKSVVTETNNFRDAIAFFEMAINACGTDPRNTPFIETIQEKIGFCSKRTSKYTEDTTLDDEMLQTDDTELIAKHGYHNLFIALSGAINKYLGRQQTKALALWQKANQILTENNQEEYAISHYQSGIKVMASCFNISDAVDNQSTAGKQYELLQKRLATGAISEPHFFANALLTAFYCTSTSEDEQGITIIKELAGKAFAHPDLEPFIPLTNFLYANLCLNAGVDSWNNGDPIHAIDRYFDAMNVFLAFRFPRFVRDILSRLEDIASKGNEDQNARILVHMTYKALDIENLRQPYLMETSQRLYKLILLNHTPASGKTNPVVLAFLSQLMKGYSYNALLQIPAERELMNDKEITGLLDTIQDIQKEATDPTMFDFSRFINKDHLLASYAGLADKEEGTTAATRLKNCKISLDELVNRKLIPQSEKNKDVVKSDKELMALLPANTVMICQLLAPSPDGYVAMYNFIFTNEEAHLTVGSIASTQSSIIEMEEQGIKVRIPWLGMHVIQIRKDIQKDPENVGLSRKAAEQLQLEAEFLLGGNMKELLNRFKAQGKDHLCIWPHGPFHYFPFHLLPLNGGPICAQWKISYLPSIGILQRAKASAPAQSTSALQPLTVMGITFLENNPYNNLSSLPDSANEAKAISQVFGVTPLLEEEVTEEAFLHAMQHSKRVHLSTHGLFDANAPIFHCLCLHKSANSDGLLNAYEVLEYNFDHVDLLTLSACETALGRFDSSDNLRGLPAMLLKAGVRTIIGALWDAESQSCNTFFVALYTALQQGATKFEAFNIAQQQTREQFPDYRDWGAFIYSGE